MILYIDMANKTIAIGLDEHIRRLCALIREKLQHLDLCEKEYSLAYEWMMDSLIEEMHKPRAYTINENEQIVSYGIDGEHWFTMALKSTTNNFISSCVSSTSVRNDPAESLRLYRELLAENTVWCEDSIKYIKIIMNDEVISKLTYAGVIK